MMRRQVNSASEISYQTGWCYHNQLNGLRTSSPHVMPEPSSLPADVDPAKLREQELTRAGFIPGQGHASAYLYRAHSGPSWIRDGIKALSAKAVAPYWLTGWLEPPKAQACMPRKYQRASLEPGNAIENMRTLFHKRDVAIGITECTRAMPYFLRNADGDDLFFVQEGEGVLETEFGPLGLEEGYFVWVPRGTQYRIVPDSAKLFMFHMENYGERFEKPETGITGDAALYYHRNIQVPVVQYDLSEGDFEVIVKQGGAFTSYHFSHHPCDVIGWDGDLAPFRFNIQDFKPITSWRAHIPPSAYCAFIGQGFEVCCFVPRPVEHAERSLPVPFDHVNHDRDEVSFYHKGLQFSRTTSEPGALTFHARGFPHDPNESALRRQEDRREREGAFILDAYALLIETSLPLSVAPWCETIEDKDYINNWQT